MALVAASPCALAISIPVAVVAVVANGVRAGRARPLPGVAQTRPIRQIVHASAGV